MIDEGACYDYRYLRQYSPLAPPDIMPPLWLHHLCPPLAIEGERKLTKAEKRSFADVLKRRDNHKEVAAMQLQKAIQFCNEEHPHVLHEVNNAISCLNSDGTVGSAMAAVQHVAAAIKMSKHKYDSDDWGDTLDIALHEASKALRDCMSCRAQIATGPFGHECNKEMYISILEDAYGGKIPENTKSLFMQSYNKAIYFHYKQHGAFPTNNALDSLSRGGARPGKQKKKETARDRVLQARKKAGKQAVAEKGVAEASSVGASSSSSGFRRISSAPMLIVPEDCCCWPFQLHDDIEKDPAERCWPTRAPGSEIGA